MFTVKKVVFPTKNYLHPTFVTVRFSFSISENINFLGKINQLLILLVFRKKQNCKNNYRYKILEAFRPNNHQEELFSKYEALSYSF